MGTGAPKLENLVIITVCGGILAVFRPAWATSYTDQSEIWLWRVYPFILAHQFRDFGVPDHHAGSAAIEEGCY